MVESVLEQDYKNYLEARKAVIEAEERGNEAEREDAKSTYRKSQDSIRAKGGDYEMIFYTYYEAKIRGNEHIDLSEPYQYCDVEKIINLLRKYGFEYITFSSEWSGAVKVAWKLTQLGCTIEGMTEINGTSREYFSSNKYRRVPAYLFRLA